MENKKDIKALISEYFIFIIFVALVVVLTIMKPSFISGRNLGNILKQASINGILAFGMMFVIISGGFDMSVGSTLAFAGVLAALLGKGQVPLIVPMLVAMIAGLGVGILNGVGIAVGNLPAFIMTLGTQTGIRGLALLVCGGNPVTGLSEQYRAIAAGTILGIPNLAVFLIVVIIICSFVATKTVYGRRVYSCGGNVQAARVAGINTSFIRVSTFAIAGLLAGLCGFLMTSRVTIGQPTAGESYEMDAITACVVGGVSASGGAGTVLGMVIGATLIGVINKGMTLISLDANWQRVVKGFVLLAAVVFDILSKKREK